MRRLLEHAPAWQLSVALHSVLLGIALWASARDVPWEEMGTRADDLPAAFAPTPWEGFDAAETPAWPEHSLQQALNQSAQPAEAPLDPSVSEAPLAADPNDACPHCGARVCCAVELSGAPAQPASAAIPSPDTLATYLDWQSASKFIHPCKGMRWWLLYRSPIRGFRQATTVWLAWTCSCTECRELCRSPNYPCMLRWLGKPRTGLTATERMDHIQQCYCRYCRPQWIPGYWEKRRAERRQRARR